MNESEWIVAALTLLATAAMACLCLAMKRHRHAWNKTGYALPVKPRTLRIGGWALITLLSGTAVRVWDWGIGPVIVFGCLSFGAVAALVLASFRVWWLPGAGVIAGTFGLIVLGWAVVA